MLPTKIQLVFEQPKVFEMVAAIGVDSVKNQIEFELLNLANLMSVGGNLNDAQIQFIAAQLVELYPMESIADFKICFNRGAIGSYGPIQRMDGITIRDWMAKYLEEKYLIMEDMLMQEKDNIYKPVSLNEEEQQNVNRLDVDKMLNDYKESIKSFEARAILPLTEKEIEEEGQVEPKRNVYAFRESEALQMYIENNKNILHAQKMTLRERHPDWTEEQINERCLELQEHLLAEETKPKFCTDIGKIWEKKKQRRK